MTIAEQIAAAVLAREVEFVSESYGPDEEYIGDNFKADRLRKIIIEEIERIAPNG